MLWRGWDVLREQRNLHRHALRMRLWRSSSALRRVLGRLSEQNLRAIALLWGAVRPICEDYIFSVCILHRTPEAKSDIPNVVQKRFQRRPPLKERGTKHTCGSVLSSQQKKSNQRGYHREGVQQRSQKEVNPTGGHRYPGKGVWRQ